MIGRQSARLAFLFALLLGLAPRIGGGATVDRTWISDMHGNWSEAFKWGPPGVPDNTATTFYRAFVNNIPINNVVVTVDGDYAIDFLNVQPGDEVAIANSRRLTVSAARGDGLILNNGTISLRGAANNTYLFLDGGPVTLDGGGQLIMFPAATNWIYQTNLGSLNIQAQIIRGAGNLGYDGSPTPITNAYNGAIIADTSVPLIVDPSTLSNSGVLRAENGATLQLNDGVYTNSGLIEAADASLVTLMDGVAISGGTLRAQSTGRIRSAGLSPSLDDLTLQGVIEIPNSRRLLLEPGTIQNTGTINLQAGASNTYLFLDGGPVTLAGGGEVLMSPSASNWIYQTNLGSLINQDNTIRGGGNLGYDGSPTPITNSGTVVADGATPLIIDPSTLSNSGVLRAENGATLQLNDGVYTNSSLIEAADASLVTLASGAAITGGTLRSQGSGRFQSAGLTPSLDDLTLEGVFEIPNSLRLLLKPGTIQNTGTINLQAGAGNTYLFLDGGPVTLTGGGQVILSSSASNWLYQTNLGSLINQDNTIRGGGNLGWIGSQTPITNAGTIIADAAAVLTIDPHNTAGFTNTGSLHVTGSGGMNILDGPINHGGIAMIAAGTRLTRAGNWTQTGGSTRVDGVLDVNSGIIDLQAGTLSGSGRVENNVSNVGTGTVAPGGSIGTLSIVGTYNQGANAALAIELGGYGAGANDTLIVSGAATVGGTITVTLVNGFVPTSGDLFTILTGASVTNASPNVVPVNFPNGLTASAFFRTGAIDLSISGLASVEDGAAIDLREPLIVYPNPSSGTKIGIAFQLPEDQTYAELSIFDPRGRKMATLFSGAVAERKRFLTWDSRDASGLRVAPGVYYARLSTNRGYREVRRFTILR